MKMNQCVFVRMILVSTISFVFTHALAETCSERRTSPASHMIPPVFEFSAHAVKSGDVNKIELANACLWNKSKDIDGARGSELGMALLFLAHSSPRLFLASIPSERDFEWFLSSLSPVFDSFEGSRAKQLEKARKSLLKRMQQEGKSARTAQTRSYANQMVEALDAVALDTAR
jgi:hypothetical protein